MLVSAVLSLVYYRSLKKNGLQILSVLLPLVFLQELALFLRDKVWGILDNNAPVYNVYRIITVLVFAALYYQASLMASLRKWIIVLTIGYLLVVIVNYSFFESLFTTSSYLSLLRGFIITIFAVLFLFRYFNLDSRTEEKFWQPLLWVTVGVVTFYPVISISIAFQKFLAASNATLFGFKVYQLIPQVMSIFMYSCFSYAFYLCQKKK